jgi:phosphopantetheinyl transferase
VRAPTKRSLHISISHKDDVAVAIASDERAVGIDVERIAPRDDSFAELCFTSEELRLVRDEPRDEGWTRLWSAKEAAAKAAGTGLAGSPARFPVRDRAGDRLLVGDTWLRTKRQGDYMIGWLHA